MTSENSSEMKPHKSYEEQVDLLIERGISINNKEDAIKKIEHINYYKIKEFAEPFIDNSSKKLKYLNINFDEILKRFYIDKELRISLLHAIEKIELSFKNKVAYTLGKENGTDYLEFEKWCESSLIMGRQDSLKEFENKVKKITEDTKNKNIIEFLEQNKNYKFPPIWVIVNTFDFGTSVFLFELMNSNLKEEIAKFYQCNTTELKSWIKHINLVRNLCAHNTKIIDVGYVSKVIIRERWQESLFLYLNKRREHVLTNKIVITIVVLKYLICQINSNYNFEKIFEILYQMADDDLKAKKIGFKDYSSIEKLKNEILT